MKTGLPSFYFFPDSLKTLKQRVLEFSTPGIGQSTTEILQQNNYEINER